MVDYNKVKQKSTKIEKNDGTAVRKKQKAVAKGRVRKPSLLSRAGLLFFGEGGFKGVVQHLVHEVIIPSAQNTFVDITTTAIQRAVLGDDYIYHRQPTQYWGRGRNNVTRMDTHRGGGRIDYDRQFNRRSEKTSDVLKYVDFETAQEAQEIFNIMLSNLEHYKVVSVADYYELSDIPSRFTDNSYGWTDLRGSKIVAARGGGYTIQFPPVEEI